MNLFTYGTLMSGELRESVIPKDMIKERINSFILAEKLYNYVDGGFPVLLLNNNENFNLQKIHGELIIFKDGIEDRIKQVYNYLDIIEGVANNLYKKDLVTVHTSSAKEKAYCYNIHPSNNSWAKELPLITSGNWRLRND